MSALPEALYEPDGPRLVPTGLTRGPWDNAFQHGGPPSALLAGACARWGEGADAWQLARITVELLRPVPLRPLELAVAPLTEGRAVDRLVARLCCDGREVAIASAVRIRRAPLDVPAPPPLPPWPDPVALPGFRFHFFRHEVAFHRAVELRPVSGAWGSTPIAFWTRLAVPLVAGRPLLPAERVVVMADAQSGMGVPLDPARFTFVNPDLTVHLARDPVGAWVGFDIRSVAHGSGVGLAQSAIRDVDGEIGRSAQGLVVAARG